jgi:hypothetical protein
MVGVRPVVVLPIRGGLGYASDPTGRTAPAIEKEAATMKISNTLVLAAVMGLLGGCQKSQPDTAIPDDAVAPADPATDDFSVPADDADGDAEEASEESDEEGDAEAPTAEE